MKGYVNAEEVLSFSNSNDLTNSLLDLQIGREPGYTSYFNGYIDDVAIWNIGFSDSDVIDLKNQSIFVAGVFDHNEGIWKNKTKRKASRRHIEIQNEFMPILIWWLKKIKDMNNPYLFPSFTTLFFSRDDGFYPSRPGCQ